MKFQITSKTTTLEGNNGKDNKKNKNIIKNTKI